MEYRKIDRQKIGNILFYIILIILICISITAQYVTFFVNKDFYHFQPEDEIPNPLKIYLDPEMELSNSNQ